MFDLDGTLVDTAPDLVASLNHVLKSVGRPALALAHGRRLAGAGGAYMIDRGLALTGGPADHDQAELLERFLAHYRAHLTDLSKPFPGVAACLAVLHENGAMLGVCTNKPQRYAVAVLNGVALAQHFCAVVGGDQAPGRKPDPVHIHATLEAMEASHEGAVMVGDTAADVMAARGAGVDVIVVDHGYTEAPAATLGADAVLHDWSALPAMLAAPPWRNRV